MWNKSICLTSRKTVLLIVVILLSTLVLASVWPTTVEEIKETPPINDEETEMWVPTQEDIAYQDSMFSIIQNTQKDKMMQKQVFHHIFFQQ